jgi:hypothetical protein
MHALLYLLPLLAVLACADEAPRPPDLLLVTIDALAADRLSCFGGPEDAGRALCALAEGGTRFLWTAAPGGGPASTAASVLTGLPASLHGVRDDGPSFLADHHETLAEGLTDAGYRSAAFVAQPSLNRSRRLDQGFGHYDARVRIDSRSESTAAAPIADRVQDWLDVNPPPRFIWIHLPQATGAGGLDGLAARLSRVFEPEGVRPGVLFLALRGEEPADVATTNRPPGATHGQIAWRSHRVPLLWRPPEATRVEAIASSRRLASLLDVFPTLRSAAGLSPTKASRDRDQARDGLESINLEELAQGPPAVDPEPGSERFVLLSGGGPRGEVGLASQGFLYARARSPEDGSGRPLSVEALGMHGARFAALPDSGGLRESPGLPDRIFPGPWRSEILAAESPVPRLEFHLARLLALPTDTDP